MTGLIIINADDFGGQPLATDRIVECFSARRLTSTTAMVYMGDSSRAACIASELNLPVGLHLNLTQEFDDPSTPVRIRERQADVIPNFAGRRSARIKYNSSLSSGVRRCVEDQLEAFRQIFGREPTHIDGHNHVHMSPSVLLALPRGIRIRTAESRPGERIGLGAVARRARHSLIARRYRTTDYFFAIDRINPLPPPANIARVLKADGDISVEIMVHPNRDTDYRFLLSDECADLLNGWRLGSFEQL